MSLQLYATIKNTGDPLRKLILRCIADHLDTDGCGFISIEPLSEYSECSHETVRLKLIELGSLGFIKISLPFSDPIEVTLIGYKDWADSARRPVVVHSKQLGAKA